jgi:hypothetical protein
MLLLGGSEKNCAISQNLGCQHEARKEETLFARTSLLPQTRGIGFFERPGCWALKRDVRLPLRACRRARRIAHALDSRVQTKIEVKSGQPDFIPAFTVLPKARPP